MILSLTLLSLKKDEGIKQEQYPWDLCLPEIVS
jgi:hypothetical protein